MKVKKLESDIVQMASWTNGATEELYKLIKPKFVYGLLLNGFGIMTKEKEKGFRRMENKRN